MHLKLNAITLVSILKVQSVIFESNVLAPKVIPSLFNVQLDILLKVTLSEVPSVTIAFPSPAEAP